MKPSDSHSFFNVSTSIKAIILFVLIFSLPSIGHARFKFSHNSGAPPQFHTTHNEPFSRENRCLQTGQWIGAISGSAMGLAHVYWSATGVSGIHGPFWKNLVTGIPSAVLGAYVGSKTTKWTTRQIMRGNPKPGRAAFRGAAYGAINGAIILTSSLVPLLITGYYADTIHFNLSDDLIILKLLGTATMGGILYGGTFGATVGALYGPCISLYMKF